MAGLLSSVEWTSVSLSRPESMAKTHRLHSHCVGSISWVLQHADKCINARQYVMDNTQSKTQVKPVQFGYGSCTEWFERLVSDKLAVAFRQFRFAAPGKRNIFGSGSVHAPSCTQSPCEQLLHNIFFTPRDC